MFKKIPIANPAAITDCTQCQFTSIELSRIVLFLKLDSSIIRYKGIYSKLMLKQ